MVVFGVAFSLLTCVFKFDFEHNENMSYKVRFRPFPC